MKPRGYIALDRGAHDHPVFSGRDDWFRAWTWMLARAAWKAEGRRGLWGTVHVERGQLVATLRDLGKAWDWPKSNVDCFLKRLAREDMLTLQKTRTATRTSTRTLPHPVTVITICNYEKFQSVQMRAEKPGQQPGQDPGQGIQETLPLQGLPAPQPLNHITKEIEKAIGEGREGKRAAAAPPKEGTRSRKHGTIYYRRHSAEWKVYADDFKTVRGALPLPDRHGGFWFFYLGEAARPAQQRGWRRA